MFDAATRRKIPHNATVLTDAAVPIGYIWPDPDGDGGWCLYSPYHAGTIITRATRSAAAGYVRGQHNRRRNNGEPNPMVGR